MALNMLVSGADCGPINPLQGLAKRFDQDRGIQQDQFVSGRAGPSRQTFRSAQVASPGIEEEAARFFTGNAAQNDIVRLTSSLSPRPFDLSALQNNLPAASASLQRSPHTIQAPQHFGKAPLANWAADFMNMSQQQITPQAMAMPAQAQTDVMGDASQRVNLAPNRLGMGMQWSHSPSPMAMHTPARVLSPHQMQTPESAVLWDKEFQSREAHSVVSPSLQTEETVSDSTQETVRAPLDADELARTAAELLDAVKTEQNPKFKNSQFLQLMRGLKDGEIVVDGNDMVQKSEASGTPEMTSKGKGKERMQYAPNAPMQVSDPSTSQARQETQQPEIEDSIDAYFRQHNEDYINYWNEVAGGLNNSHLRSDTVEQNVNEWGALQDSWDAFEASTWGIKPVPRYEFQPQNPYLREGANQSTRHHAAHSAASMYDNVLELEAEVQRNKDSAVAWYNLGVKQQENEREPKAIAALTRALALDDTHLPTWLALAISNTNEGNRAAADDAIEQWVRRNDQYAPIVRDFFERAEKLNGGTLESLSQARRHDELIHCLMAMVRSGNGAVDADVQVALAVLLNASEDYPKAQDCFKAALSARPDDWQLYNRVGATLANSGFSQEALDYYYRAIELNPAYIRARYNLGISFMNMRRYREAAEYILDALAMQESDASIHGTEDKRGITSSALWDSLRTSMLQLQEVDLAMICDKQDIDEFRRLFHKQ